MKIAVVGPYNSGKSTFIHKICPDAFSIDKSGTTVALDHGKTTVLGLPIFLFGTPGLERFEIVRRLLMVGSDGILLVIDSINPASIEEGKEILETIYEVLPKETPVVVCANKQDIEGALSPEKIETSLNLAELNIPIYPTSALTGEGIDKALKTVVLLIINRYYHILKIIKNYGPDIEDIRTALKKGSIEILRLLQWLEWRKMVQVDWEKSTAYLPPRLRDIIDILEISRNK